MKSLFSAEPIPNSFLPWQDRDALSVFARKINSSVLRDRFGFLNQFSKWNLSGELDTFPCHNRLPLLQNIMGERAYVYCNRLLNEQLVFSYSGGVDSTAMLSSIIAMALQLEYPSTRENFKVIVLLTESSIKENPGFYAWLKNINKKHDFLLFFKPDLNCHEAITWIQREGYTVVSGFPADQLFGSIIGQEPEIAALYHHDWKEWFEKGEEDAVDQFQSAFNYYYGLPIKTLGQFLWFMNFATKWHVVLHFDCFIADQTELGKFEGFYDTPEFQQWSVSNFDELHNYPQTDNEHYKKELKTVIREMCSLANLKFSCDDKEKLGSWGYSKTIDGDHGKKNPRFSVVEEENGILQLRRFVDTFSEHSPYSREYLEKQAVLARNCLRNYRKGE